MKNINLSHGMFVVSTVPAGNRWLLEMQIPNGYRFILQPGEVQSLHDMLTYILNEMEHH